MTSCTTKIWKLRCCLYFFFSFASLFYCFPVLFCSLFILNLIFIVSFMLLFPHISIVLLLPVLLSFGLFFLLSLFPIRHLHFLFCSQLLFFLYLLSSMLSFLLFKLCLVWCRLATVPRCRFRCGTKFMNDE
jgi:hypothetical protein